MPRDEHLRLNLRNPAWGLLSHEEVQVGLPTASNRGRHGADWRTFAPIRGTGGTRGPTACDKLPPCLRISGDVVVGEAESSSCFCLAAGSIGTGATPKEPRPIAARRSDGRTWIVGDDLDVAERDG
eukprot:11952313-Alexandrium_andersonii.AAC.1